MALRQIITDWTTASGAGKATVMYFDAEADVALQRERIDDLWHGIYGVLSSTVVWRVRTDGVEVDEATGALLGAWADSTLYTDSGDSAAEPVADATQVLLRWSTADVVGGRFVRGRTFVPGFTANNLHLGNVNDASVALITDACTAFWSSLALFRIWHRPSTGSGGSAHDVTGGVCWPELAVLRRRRG